MVVHTLRRTRRWLSMVLLLGVLSSLIPNAPLGVPTIAHADPPLDDTFPLTPILDTFDVPDGALSNGWMHSPANYTIQNSTLYSGNNTAIYWPTSYGADQEAYVTFIQPTESANEVDLLLKAQDASQQCELIEVLYSPVDKVVQVQTCHNGTWVNQGAAIPAAFVEGDQLGARARADGSITIYRDQISLGTITLDTNAPFATSGGQIGLWLVGASDVRLDDFGGGTAPATTTPELTPPTPPTLPAAPVPPTDTDPHLPSLGIDVGVRATSLALTETTIFTVTVTNSAPADAATNVVVTAPTPTGTTALAGPGFVSASGGWQWTKASLTANSTTVFTGSLQLTTVPPGAAVIITPSATAQGLPASVSGTGGVLVRTAASVASTTYTAGTAQTLTSADSRVKVDFAANTYTQTLTLKTTQFVAEPIPGSSTVAGTLAGLSTFTLDATNSSNQVIHQFTNPFTLTVQYTPEALQAAGLTEDTLAIRWFDPTGQYWDTLPTTIDREARTATAAIDHFSTLSLGDGTSPSASFIPTLHDWHGNMFTGASAYSYPIQVPAGPGGLAPKLQLGYSSDATDGARQMRMINQSSWVGKGWNLATSYIARNVINTYEDGTTDIKNEYYSLVMDGISTDIVVGNGLVANPDVTKRTQWNWRTTDEHFIRVRATNDAGDGWSVWTKDGTRYTFDLKLSSNLADGKTRGYKWMLRQVLDTHGNTITYTYRCSDNAAQTCAAQSTQPMVWPDTIMWGKQSEAVGRYRVRFASTRRGNDGNKGRDMVWSTNTKKQYADGSTPHESRQLNAIYVEANTAAQGSWQTSPSWQLVRQYNMRYAAWDETDPTKQPLYSDEPDPSGFSYTTFRKLTLMGISVSGTDGKTLPETTFTYNLTRGTGTDACGRTAPQFFNAGWNRLATVNNGQGGTITFSYEHLATVLDQQYHDTCANVNADKRVYGNAFLNRQRLSQVVITNGLGESYLTTYSYGAPALNWNKPPVGAGLPNSAEVWFTDANTAGDELITKKTLEFRGHAWTIERTYDGGTTSAPLLQQAKHFYYQGDAGCTPGIPSAKPARADPAQYDACFKQIRNNEFLKGQEYRTEIGSTTPLLQVMTHAFAVPDANVDYTSKPRRGLWRTWTYEQEQAELRYEGQATPKQRTTAYTYDPTAQGGLQYGNVTKVAEYDGTSTGTLLRTTEQTYAVTDTLSVNNPTLVNPRYIVDRIVTTLIRDGASNPLALSHMLYDNNQTTLGKIGAIGDLTRKVGYYDVPAATLHGRDETYGYDSYGNRTTLTTYRDASTCTFNTTTKTCSAFGTVGNGSPARTTTTAYTTSGFGSTFSVFPTSVQLPSVGGASAMNESAAYDYQKGVMTSVTDVNGNVSTAEYDVFGRMTKLIKPGNTATYPTAATAYYDVYTNAQNPVKAITTLYESAVANSNRPIVHIYDGLGKEIQTKAETTDGFNQLITDRRYDALGRVTKESQPYERTASGNFFNYRAPEFFNPTTTTYDQLGRMYDVKTPDGKTTQSRYFISTVGWASTVTDRNQHKTRRETDLFGRLRSVIEYSGNAGSEGAYTTYATTTYTYDALDQLKTVVDAKTNTTTLTYDTLGRKTQMIDPDMGTWNYAYDVNGNLMRQTDAHTPTRQRICFFYDELYRLMGKTYRSDDSCPTTIPATPDVRYTYDQNANGKGQRTGMNTPSSGNALSTSYAWTYDNRERQTNEAITVGSTTRTITHTYDVADRVTRIGYPSQTATTGEVVNYTYDPAWRPKTLQQNGGTTYVQDASYTWMEQPKLWKLGNGLATAWGYDGQLKRLNQLNVGTPNGAAVTPTVMNRSYRYDLVGNVKQIDDTFLGDRQVFQYDHRDRLTHAWTTAIPGAGTIADSASTLALTHPDESIGAAASSTTLDPVSGVPQLADVLAPVVAEAAPAVPPAGQTPVVKPRPNVPPPSAPLSSTLTTRMPLIFAANNGQADANLPFVSVGSRTSISFAASGARISIPRRRPAGARARTHVGKLERPTTSEPADANVPPAQVDLQLDGANPAPVMSGTDRLPTQVNYFIGTNPATWQTNVPAYTGVLYKDIYPGVDLHYEGTSGQLKRTYVVAPGANVDRIRWRYGGTTDLSMSAKGEVQVRIPAPTLPITMTQRGTATGTVSPTADLTTTLTEQPPLAWQEIGGQRVPIAVRYALQVNGSVGFSVGIYDHTQPLILDPVLTTTILGGTGTDAAGMTTVSSTGTVYACGYTTSTDFPTAPTQYGGRGAGTDITVIKFAADGHSLQTITYLGGNGDDNCTDLTTDASGNVYLVGNTTSTNIPVSASTLHNANAGNGDGYVARLPGDLSQVAYGTYLGGSGSEFATGIAVDASNRIYVSGETTSTVFSPAFVTPSGLQSTCNGCTTSYSDAFVVRLTSAGSYSYGTYLGGYALERPYALDVTPSGTVTLAGVTNSTDFPVLNALQSTYAGDPADGFVASINSGGTGFVYKTFLGGNGDEVVYDVAVDTAGNAYLAETTNSAAFLTAPGYQPTPRGGYDGLAVKLAANGTLVWRTYIGGSGDEWAGAIAVDRATGVATVVGYTNSDAQSSTPFPLVRAIQTVTGGGFDAFVTRIAATGTSLVYSTLVGGASDDFAYGVAVDAGGTAYATGSTVSSQLPGTLQPRDPARTDADNFVMQLWDLTPSYDESYVYNEIGNLTNKAGVAMSYGSTGNSTGTGPHQARTVNGQSYTYDGNGNLLTGGGRTIAWGWENRPTSVTGTDGVTEYYTYNGDGERVAVTRNSATMLYLDGLWEELIGGTGLTTNYYTFSGQTVAMRSGTSAPTYLHGDHLGSVSVATSSTGALLSQQSFTPWGQVRGGNVGQTNHNYTGQQLDKTGLLYYHARMYDPVLGRLVSADSIVPGTAMGAGGALGTLGYDKNAGLAPLTVDFHEPGFVSTLSGENGSRQTKGFWFQLSGDDKQKAPVPWGPANPQALNRYSYVLNNPIRYEDPSGHFGVTQYNDGSGEVAYHLTHDEATALWEVMKSDLSTIMQVINLVITGIGKGTFEDLPIFLMKAIGLSAGAAGSLADFLYFLGENGAASGILMGLVTLGGGILALADAWNGHQGVDIVTINNNPNLVWLQSPTVSRQHGYWMGNKKVCVEADISCYVNTVRKLIKTGSV